MNAAHSSQSVPQPEEAARSVATSSVVFTDTQRKEVEQVEVPAQAEQVEKAKPIQEKKPLAARAERREEPDDSSQVDEIPVKENPSTLAMAVTDAEFNPPPIDQGNPISLQSPSEATDVSAVAPQPEEKFADKDPTTSLSAGLGFSYTQISAHDPVNGGNASFISNAAPKIQLGWDLAWNPKWASHVRFSYLSEKFVASASSMTVANSNPSVFESEIGVDRKWNSASRTSLSIGSAVREFANATAATNINLNHVQELKLTVAHEQDLISFKTAKAGAGLSLSALGGGSGPGFQTKPGWGGDASIYVRHDLKNAPIVIKGEASYGIWSQNSNLLQENGQHMGVLLSVSWRIGQ